MKEVSEMWLEILKILIKYKFANKGTAESTADEIYNLFLNQEVSSIAQKEKENVN